jgi:glycyl-tRNA synthetase beta chain
MAEFLLELLSEEIPARMQTRAAFHLAALVEKALGDASIEHEPITAFSTPRRLVLISPRIAPRQPDQEIERRGPRVDAPEKAIEGFKSSLAGEDYQLAEREEKKGRVLIATFRKEGQPTRQVLGPMLLDILEKFPWPKSMRWADHKVRWVRPLHSILCLLDNAVVPFVFGPVESGCMTQGHRFHAPEPFPVADLGDYRAKLARAFVVLDPAERRAGIKGQAELIAKNERLRLRADDALLDELTGLVEWPVALSGEIEQSFMALPPEVLVTSMRSHQKYLALENTDGRLAPKFIAIANLEAEDGGAAIVAGNERVLRARLWDAKFFWDQDKRTPLASRLPKLDAMVFHAKLGSIGDKAKRIEQLAGYIAERIGADPVKAKAAARLAKADLVTGMVGEFPELQGFMGRYYARHEGLDPEIADAIGQHYAPQGPGDACPTAPVSTAVALADKLDTLAGFFAIDEKPTGSKDPFALRRAALGVIRLVLENRLRLSLRAAFADARMGYPDVDVGDLQANMDDLQAFFADRLKVHLRGEGVRHDLISAVFATGDDDVVRLLARVAALDDFLATDNGANLLAGYRRASNIVRIEAKRDGAAPDGNVDDALLRSPEERALYDGLMAAENRINQAVAAEDFAGAMAALADLRPPIDRFFDKVIVNDENRDLRHNRLSLLSNIHRALAKVADFSLIEDVVNDNNNRRVA